MFKNKFNHKFFKIICSTLSQLVLLTSFLLPVLPVNAAEVVENQPTVEQSDLANEVERLKKEVLKLNRELFILEEDFLF